MKNKTLLIFAVVALALAGSTIGFHSAFAGGISCPSKTECIHMMLARGGGSVNCDKHGKCTYHG